MSDKQNFLYRLLMWFVPSIANLKESWGCGNERVTSGAKLSLLLFWVSPMCLFLVLLSGAEALANDSSIHPWGYEGGEGPGHWGETEQDHEKHLM